MKLRTLEISTAAALAAMLALAGCGGSSSNNNNPIIPPATGEHFTQVNLVADTAAAGATVVDKNLVNPWGISFAPGGPFWVSDNGPGLSTLYNGAGAVQGLVVAVPGAGGKATSPVTGQVYNGTGDFAIPAVGGSLFIFDSEDGTISAWGGSSGTTATVVADRSATGAIYTGLAIASNAGANFLYAANFSGGTVDVFDKTFTFTKSFTDPSLPAGYAPFNVQTLNGNLYVTYGKQDPTKHFAVSGVGNGYVDVFSPAGTLVSKLIATGSLNAPWGVAIAPAGYGKVGGDLLVGNLGDGTINAFNATTGAKVMTLQNATGGTLAIDGLWALTFGNGGQGGATNTLYFTAGPAGYTHGLLGSLTPAN